MLLLIIPDWRNRRWGLLLVFREGVCVWLEAGCLVRGARARV
jgi:hypothetical protein